MMSERKHLVFAEIDKLMEAAVSLRVAGISPTQIMIPQMPQR